MKQLFLLFTLSLSFCNGRVEIEHQTNKDKKEITPSSYQNYLTSLAIKYGKSKTLTSLYFIEPKSLNNIVKQIDSLNIKFCRIDQFFNTQKIDGGLLLEKAELYFDGMDRDMRNKKIKNIEQWLRNDILLSSVLDNNLGKDIFFEEVISKISEVRPLLNAYLKMPDQYFGSLDVNQSCKLYYDVNSFIVQLDSIKRIEFFKNYFATACELSLSDSTTKIH